MPEHILIHPEIETALASGLPVVALESALITHGLPRPLNIDTVLAMESEIRSSGAIPATTAVLAGQIHVGLERQQLEHLAGENNVLKVSSRGLSYAVALGTTAGTTVSGTLWIAERASIRFFATGGIGGVHRGVEETGDISSDLIELSRTPVAVICAGAKSILDLPRTLEYLETVGVPVLGYRTDEFPAFFQRSSGLPVDYRVDDPADAAAVCRTHRKLGLPSGVLIACPPPVEDADDALIEQAIEQAIGELAERGVHGGAVTPYLLQRISELTDGASLRANTALLRNNARIAAEIAVADAVPGEQ